MATTTNYSWTTPDDTDLVKDGAAAIRTLGSSADTTVKNLNPGTTAGDIDYYTSSTAKARIAIGTAGQVLKVNSGGTAPEWGTTADQTPLTTKGDLFTFDTADARLGVGANGTVLTADSAETTGLKWAAPGGGLTLLDTLTLSGSSTTSSTFSSSYKYLQLYCKGVYASASSSLNMRLNADTGNNYAFQLVVNGGTEIQTATSKVRIGSVSTHSATLETSYTTTQIWRPSDTDVVFVESQSVYRGGTNPDWSNSCGLYDNSAAITSVTIYIDSGTFTAGTVYIYGGN